MAALVLIDPTRRQAFPLEHKLDLGRDWSNDIQLLDVKVSRSHARLMRRGKIFVLRDLDSHNGTYVNDEPTAECELRSGDRVQVGDTRFVFLDDDDYRPQPLPLAEPYPDPEPEDLQTQKVTFSLHGDLGASFLQQEREFGDHELLRRAQRDLTALFEISNLLNVERDRSALFEKITDRIAQMIRAESIYLMEIEEHGGVRRPVARVVRSMRPQDPGTAPLSQSILRKVVEEGQSLLVHDAITDQRFAQSESVVINRLRSVMCVPIRAQTSVLGLIYLSNEAEAGVFTRYDLQLLTAIGIEAGIALENRILFENLENLFLATIEALAATIDAKDGYTAGHSRRVADNAVVTAAQLGLTEEEGKEILIGGILHDIGKIGIPDSVLKLPQQFDHEQRLEMERHPVVGAEILAPIPRMRRVATMVRHHHERYDGDGYPDGLSDDAIPLASRIIAVCDTFDAITSTRIYRKGRTIASAIAALQEAAGRQFDPDVVEAFLRALERGQIHVSGDSQA